MCISRKAPRWTMLVINSRFWIPIVALALPGGLAGYLTDTYFPGMLPPSAPLWLACVCLGGALGFSLLSTSNNRNGDRWSRRTACRRDWRFLWNRWYLGCDACPGYHSGIAFFISWAILKDLYGGSNVEAFQHHIHILFAARGS